jgi:cytochrome c oxidase assembly protein subunit 15/protoheme IX farnesyltransferase
MTSRTAVVLNTTTSERSLRYFARFAWTVLAFNVAVIVEGAFVRATGSGAGCGNHWPLCNGKLVFGSRSTATLIEFAHRSMTGIDTLMILALVVWAFRLFPKGHAARIGVVLSTVFMVTEALIGAALVKFGLVVNDTSPARAAVLSLHLANTMTLLACLTLTAWWARHARLRPSPKEWISLASVVLLGISGALTALADTLYPVHSLSAGFAQDLDSSASFILRLRVFHPILAAAVAVWLIHFSLNRFSPPGRLAKIVISIVAAQFLAGIANLLLLAPIGMQLLHLLLADLLWIALVALCWSPLIRERP